MNSRSGRILILLTMLLLGADCACAASAHSDDMERSTAGAVSFRAARTAKIVQLTLTPIYATALHSLVRECGVSRPPDILSVTCLLQV